MKVLLTCFDPFGDDIVNPSSIVVSKVKDKIGDIEIIKLELPTVFHKSIKKVSDKIDEIKPDYVLSIGQAGGRNRLSVERVGINCDDARIPDNEGVSIFSEPIAADGAPAYFATIPIKRMVKSILDKQIPAEVSNTAGTYVCNHVMYGVLHHIASNNLPIKAGFIHIPYIMEQVVEKKDMPSMSVESLVCGIEAAIAAMVIDLPDEKIVLDTKTN